MHQVRVGRGVRSTLTSTNGYPNSLEIPGQWCESSVSRAGYHAKLNAIKTNLAVAKANGRPNTQGTVLVLGQMPGTVQLYPSSGNKHTCAAHLKMDIFCKGGLADRVQAGGQGPQG